MSRLGWVDGPSRMNDWTFTPLAVTDAVRACRAHNLEVAIPYVGFALDAVAALHRDAGGANTPTPK